MAQSKNRRSSAYDEPDYKSRQTNSRYNDSSSAYDYAQEEYYSPRRRKKKVIRRKVRRGSKPIIVKAEEVQAMPHIGVFLVILLIFGCAIASVASYSFVMNQKLVNNKLAEQLKTLQSRTTDLTVEVSQSMDLAEIERIARVKLEMSEPGIHQIKYISVPKQSYTVSIASEESPQVMKSEFSLSGLLKIKDFFMGD